MGYHSHIIEVPSDELLYKLYVEDREDIGYYDWNSRLLMAIRYWGTPACYKNIKERLKKLIPFYDGIDFKAPSGAIEALVNQIESSRLEPYPINIEVKPTSVIIRFRKTQLRNSDLEQINSNIDKYIESLESLPLVGKVYTDQAYMPEDFLTRPNLNPYYIKVVPRANAR